MVLRDGSYSSLTVIRCSHLAFFPQENRVIKRQHLKIITGDNEKAAWHVAEAVHLTVAGLLTSKMPNDMPNEAIWHAVERTTLFAEVDPNQKERIILALRKNKHVVGYMGDGINDAPALHAASTNNQMPCYPGSCKAILKAIHSLQKWQ
jgi:hypothetical protein